MSLRKPSNVQHDYILFSTNAIPNASEYGLTKYKKTKLDPSLMAIRPAATFMLPDDNEYRPLSVKCRSNHVYGTYGISKEELMFNLGMLNNVGGFVLFDYKELINYAHAMSHIIFCKYGMHSHRSIPIISADEVDKELIAKIILNDKTNVPGALMYKK